MIVIFRPQAVEDVVEAAAWYEAHAPGLGEQLIDCNLLDECVDRRLTRELADHSVTTVQRLL
jgi:hypothetical protein